MLVGTKKILGNDYTRFCETMIDSAENNELPIVLGVNAKTTLTTKDIKELCYEFYKDTGLDIYVHMNICHDCGELHIVFEVDYPEEEEEGKYLQ